MIRPYYGEFLISPSPVHLTLPNCTHGCVYCFVDGHNKTDFNYLNNQLHNSKKNKSLLSFFINQKYSICVSNTSDPFANIVDDVFLQTKELLDSFDIPIFYQTKGGRYCNRVLSTEKKACVYLTITSDNNEILKKYEPNAPTYEERIQLLKDFKNNIDFIIGLNPLIPDWWNDFESFVNTISDIGIKHVWHGTLHIRKNKIEISKYKKHKSLFDSGALRTKPYMPVYNYFLDILDKNDINCFSSGVSKNLNFWNFFYKNFNFFPTLDDWFSNLQKKYNGVPVAFQLNDFKDYVLKIGIPFKTEINSYLNNFGQTLRQKKGYNFKVNNFDEFFDILFDPIDYPTIFRTDNIYILVKDYESNKPILDDRGNYILVFFKDGDDSVSIHEKDVIFYNKGGD